MLEPPTAFYDALDAIDAFPKACKQVIMFADTDEKMVDALGTINSAAQRAQEEKRLAAVELNDDIEGQRWASEFKYGKYERWFNTPGLLRILMPALDYDSISKLLLYLYQNDVIRIQWQWSKLKKLINHNNIDVHIVKRQIDDDDPDAEVGELYNKGNPSYTPIESD